MALWFFEGMILWVMSGLGLCVCCVWGELFWGALATLLFQGNNSLSQSSSLPVWWLWFVCWAQPQVFQLLGLLFFPFFPVIGQRELCRQSAADFPGTASPGLGGEFSFSLENALSRCSSRSRWEGGSSDCTENALKKKKNNPLKKNKATDRRENLSSDCCFLQQRKRRRCKGCGSWQEAEMKFRGGVRFISLL